MTAIEPCHCGAYLHGNATASVLLTHSGFHVPNRTCNTASFLPCRAPSRTCPDTSAMASGHCLDHSGLVIMHDVPPRKDDLGVSLAKYEKLICELQLLIIWKKAGFHFRASHCSNDTQYGGGRRAGGPHSHHGTRPLALHRLLHPPQAPLWLWLSGDTQCITDAWCQA